MINTLKLLSKNPVFAELNNEELQFLSSIIEHETIEEGKMLIEIYEIPKYLYYIESGSFILELSNNTFKTLGAGKLIGEIGVINGDFRSGAIVAAEQSKVIKIYGTRLFDDKFIPPSVALKIVRAMSKRITNYLRSLEQISTAEIIQKGENHKVEFKSTLRWNLFTQKKDKAIEKAVLKTLSAFMNSNGGMLLVGVDDDGNILGLENDNFASHDKLLLHLTNLIKARIGATYLKYLQFSIETISEKDVLRVDCRPSAKPTYLKDDTKDHLFIRSGPSTTDLRLRKVYDYIRDRFYKN